MRKEADIFGRLPKGYIKYHMQHTKEGVTAEEIDSLINAETWKNGKRMAGIFRYRSIRKKSQTTACKVNILINITICRTS